MNKVLIDIRNGVPEVNSNNTEMDILVRDYDIQGVLDPENLPRDQEGNPYLASSGFYDPDYVEEQIAFHDKNKEV